MSIDTDLEDARCQLKDWRAALAAARTGSSYTIDGISVTRQDVARVIQPQINRLVRSVRQLEAAKAGATAPAVRVARLRSTWA